MLDRQQKAIFKAGIATLLKECHTSASLKGFWPDGLSRNKGEMMMLEVSEVAERLEAVRKSPERGSQPSEHIPDFTAEAEECADLVIRLADYCGGFAIPLAEAILAKMEFNASRPVKHNKEF